MKKLVCQPTTQLTIVQAIIITATQKYIVIHMCKISSISVYWNRWVDEESISNEQMLTWRLRRVSVLFILFSPSQKGVPHKSLLQRSSADLPKRIRKVNHQVTEINWKFKIDFLEQESDMDCNFYAIPRVNLLQKIRRHAVEEIPYWYLLTNCQNKVTKC